MVNKEYFARNLWKRIAGVFFTFGIFKIFPQVNP